MKLLFLLLLPLLFFAQPKTELTAFGFAPVEIPTPQRPLQKLIDISKAWAPYYNKNGSDVYDVTESSLNIDAFRENAFFYRNRGEVYIYRIRYTLKVSFAGPVATIHFIVKEIYADRVLTTKTTADFFAPDGRLKEDFEEVKPSLEATANNIIKSFVSFISAP